MDIHNCQFVMSSDLFEELQELCNDFCNGDPPFSWGDNNRTLVKAGDILDFFSDVCVTDADQLNDLKTRIEQFPDTTNTYVDLEN